MLEITKEILVGHIIERLQPLTEILSESFQDSAAEVGVRYCFVDDLLPKELAEKISAAFPSPGSMRLMSSFRERKYTSKSFEYFDQILSEITFAIQDPRVVEIIERITGIRNQEPDASLYAGGLSSMIKGHYLCPHLDNSHDGSRARYRTLNLLYYVSMDWQVENGGNLELWDQKVQKKITIASSFNRLAIMETTPSSWHSVSRVVTDGVRKCISNYYFSQYSPTGLEYSNVTSFSAEPDQHLLRIVAGIDNRVRQLLRLLAPGGLGKRDIYRGGRR